MPTLPTANPLEKKLLQKLSDETEAIKKAPDPKVEAGKRCSNARKNSWFAPVVKELGRLAGPGGKFVNPLYENVWDFFFIDSFGILTPRFDRATNAPNERAVTPCDFLALNRDALQVCRQQRFNHLTKTMADTLNLIETGKLTKKAARERVVTWKSEAWQPDVADYYLNGPGRKESPFKEFLVEISY